MNISVIILTCNAERYIEKQLELLFAQSVRINEIILIDSSSNDNTLAIANKYNVKIVTIQRSAFNHGRTRNLGVSLTTGDIIVFLTQDAIPANEETIGNLVYPYYRDADLAISFGRQLPNSDSNIFGEFSRIFNYPENSYSRSIIDINEYGIKTFFNSNSFSSYRRIHLVNLGLFPSDVIMCEDSVVAAKAILNNLKISYVGTACVFHSHNYTLLEEFKRYFDIGVAYGSNNWMISKFQSKKSQGYLFFKSEFKFIISRGKGYLVVYQILRTVLRLLAFNLGLRHHILPSKVAKNLSMHSYHWI